ncbi:ATP-binding protein [Dyella sp.]|uniref:ATP-binding protein n=1 Tax=Dyella sp. TaxID=1869338 RepID=UPI002ED393C7
MKRRHLFDSIAWWFALNVASAIIITMLMNFAFAQLAGVWAQPPLENTELIQQVVGMTRAMDQTPRSERQQLAQRLASPAFSAQWYPQRDQVPMSNDSHRRGQDLAWMKKVTGMLDRPDAIVMASAPHVAYRDGTPASDRYAIAIELSDHSWVQFDTARRSWGLNHNSRTLLTALFVLLSSGFIASVASRYLARPVQRFARAAEAFGASAPTEPLPLGGPLEIREAAAAFNAMQERIQQLIEARTEMITAISHDLRAPLTRMRMRGEFIEDSEQQRKLFRDVDEMQAMLEASLALFRLDCTQEDMTRFELSELIHTVIDDFRDMGQPVAPSNLMPLVYQGRPLALKRVLTNLIENAVKYGSSARVSLSTQHNQVIITVDDDGPGVPPTLLPKLFLPFFRLETSRNRATGGFGLGLPSARSIIRSHGGELRLENRQPHGLRAIVMLPKS